MKDVDRRKLKKTYAGIIGGTGCGILVLLAYLVDGSISSEASVYHFIILTAVLLYICTAVAITMFLENRSFFQENRDAKKRFIIFNVLFASILCMMLIMAYIIANYVY